VVASSRTMSVIEVVVDALPMRSLLLVKNDW